MSSLRSLAVVAAIGVLAGGAATPAAAHHDAASATASSGSTPNLGVTRRADPAIDPYIRTAAPQTPAGGLAPLQQAFSQRTHAVVVHDSDPAVSRNLLGWPQRPRVTVYANTTGVAPWRSADVKYARKLLLRHRGKPVRVDGWLGLDLRKAKARKFWLYGADGKASCTADRDRRAALDLLACGYDGLWLDNVLTDPRQGFSPTPKKVKRAQWARGVLTLMKQLRRAMPKRSTITINTHWTDTDFGWSKSLRLKRSSAHVKAARLADEVVIEGGAIDRGVHYALTERTQWSYRRLLRYADELHRMGAKLQWEKTSSSDLADTNLHPQEQLASCLDRHHPAAWAVGGAAWRAHVRTAAFNTASALLTWKPGDGVGDMCEYPDRGWRGYGVDLGAPTGRRREDGGLIVRAFSGGLVAVNPGRGALPLTLPGGRSGVDLASTAWPADDAPRPAFTVPARSAAVIRYAG